VIEQPLSARYTIDTDASSLRLIIPSRRNWFQIIVTGIWSIFWFLITLSVIGGVVIQTMVGIFNPGPNGEPFSVGTLFPGAFLCVWSTMWILGGLFALYMLARQLIGREIIEISSQSISITPKVIGFEKTKTYAAASIKELRVSPYIPQSSWMGGTNHQFLMRNTGTLAFDYGAKTIRFGDMDEAEAKMALAELLQRYPNYAR
jgi:hypothetical protein